MAFKLFDISEVCLIMVLHIAGKTTCIISNGSDWGQFSYAYTALLVTQIAVIDNGQIYASVASKAIV